MIPCSLVTARYQGINEGILYSNCSDAYLNWFARKVGVVSQANFLKMINTRTSKRNDIDITEEITDELFHDSLKDLNTTEEEQHKEITLEMIYKEIRMFKQDLSSKIDSVKEDILLKLQKENSALKTEISVMKEDLIEKARIIDELQESINKT